MVNEKFNSTSRIIYSDDDSDSDYSDDDVIRTTHIYVYKVGGLYWDITHVDITLQIGKTSDMARRTGQERSQVLALQ